jgi:POT family proton-dependent oligopeptide transporter
MWWNFWAARGKKSSSVRKMAIGCFLIGMAFLIIPLASNFITIEKSLSNLAWLASATLVVTLGELYLSPIGLSFVTKLAPARFMSMMMGMWLMSSFIGNYLAGVLGMLYGKMSQNSFFMVFAGLGIFIGLFFLIAESKLKHIVGEDV